MGLSYAGESSLGTWTDLVSSSSPPGTPAELFSLQPLDEHVFAPHDRHPSLQTS